MISTRFINPFVEGAITTLKTQCSVALNAGKLTLRKDFKQTYTIEIMAVLGLTSKTFQGSVALCFPQATFLNLMERMLGEKFPEITPELQDGAGELLNIIFGVAKARLNRDDHRIEKAIPSVIHGKEIGLKHLSSDATIVLPFDSDIGSFHLEIGMER